MKGTQKKAGSIVRRPRPGGQPGQRAALHALQPVRAILLSGLVVTLLACALVGLAWRGGSQPPVGLLVVAGMVLPLALAAWNFPRRPLQVTAWVVPAGLMAEVGLVVLWCFYSSVWNLPFRLLWAAWILFMSVKLAPAYERQAVDAVRRYQEAGGLIETLYRTAPPEDRRLVNPAAVVVAVLAITLGIASLLSLRRTVSSANSGPAVIGIGEGR